MLLQESPGVHSRLLWGKLGSKCLENGGGKKLSPLGHWKKRERGGSIVVNHDILFVARRRPPFLGRTYFGGVSLFLFWPPRPEREEGHR